MPSFSQLRFRCVVATLLLPLLIGTTGLFLRHRSFAARAQYGGLGFGLGLYPYGGYGGYGGGGLLGGAGGFGGYGGLGAFGSPYGSNYGNLYGIGSGYYYPQYQYNGGYPCYSGYFCGGSYPGYGGYPFYGNGLSTAFASSSGGVASAQASSGSGFGYFG